MVFVSNPNYGRYDRAGLPSLQEVRFVEASKIEATGFGKTSPAKFGCEDKLPRKKLIECLAPNRRVVIEVTGTAK